MLGKPTQLSHSALTSGSPNTQIHGLGMKQHAKMMRAIREKRGIRLQLSPEERKSLEYAGEGGSFSLGSLGHSITSGVNKAVRATSRAVKAVKPTLSKAVKAVKPLGIPLAKGVADVGVTAGLTALGAPELAPIGSVLTNYAIDKATKGGRLARATSIARRVKYSQRGRKMYYGGLGLKEAKAQMVSLFKPHFENAKHATQLVNKVFRDGIHTLDLPEVTISGGKFSLKRLVRRVKHHARKILFHKVAPVIKHAGQEFIKQSAPVLEEGLKSIGQQYGLDPQLTDIGSKIVTQHAENLANRGLDKYITKRESQTPEQFHDEFIQYLQHQYGGSGISGNLMFIGHPAMYPFIAPPFLPQGQISGGSFRGYGRRGYYGGSFI